MSIMVLKPECTLMLRYWENNFGFPKGGSLSKNQRNWRRNRFKKISVKMSDLKVFDSHSKCSEFWKGEVERYERKALQSSIRENVKAEESKEDESIL